MEAKVKSEHRWSNVTAFGGIEFVKSEYRKVPAGCEKEAQAHPFLEIKGKEVAQVEEPVIAEPAAEVLEVIPLEGAEQLPEVSEAEKVGMVPVKKVEKKAAKHEKTPEENAAWAAKMAQARADKKAKGG